MIKANNVVSFDLSSFEEGDHSQASFIISNRLICWNLMGRFFSKNKRKNRQKRKEKPFGSQSGQKCKAVPLRIHLKI